MWWQRKEKKLERLFDELRSIAILDRLCYAGTPLTQNDRLPCAMRQIRQSQLLIEIERLTPKKGCRMPDERQPARSWQEIADAGREQDSVRRTELAKELERALDERDGRIRHDKKSSAAA